MFILPKSKPNGEWRGEMLGDAFFLKATRKRKWES